MQDPVLQVFCGKVTARFRLDIYRSFPFRYFLPERRPNEQVSQGLEWILLNQENLESFLCPVKFIVLFNTFGSFLLACSLPPVCKIMPLFSFSFSLLSIMFMDFPLLLLVESFYSHHLIKPTFTHSLCRQRSSGNQNWGRYAGFYHQDKRTLMILAYRTHPSLTQKTEFY
jgi:hypothetical protein